MPQRDLGRVIQGLQQDKFAATDLKCISPKTVFLLQRQEGWVSSPILVSWFTVTFLFWWGPGCKALSTENIHWTQTTWKDDHLFVFASTPVIWVGCCWSTSCSALLWVVSRFQCIYMFVGVPIPWGIWAHSAGAVATSSALQCIATICKATKNNLSPYLKVLSSDYSSQPFHLVYWVLLGCMRQNSLRI